MKPPQHDLFMARWPAVKSEWLLLLRGEPALTPLGRADTIGFLMDATLMQLLAGLEAKTPESWLQICVPVIGSVHRHCACGLTPLLKYFTTGEVALRTASGPDLAGEIEEIITRFRALAQHEVDSLCTQCQHPDWVGCELRRAPAAPHNP